MVGRKTEKIRFKSSVNKLCTLMREIRHFPLKEQTEKINQVLRGHYAYYGLGGNIKSLLKIRQNAEFCGGWGCKWAVPSTRRVQYTSKGFTGLLKENQIRISMEDRCRVFDTIFIERLWRSVKQECIYLMEFTHVWDLEVAVEEYFTYYNPQRPHEALGYQTPAKV